MNMFSFFFLALTAFSSIVTSSLAFSFTSGQSGIKTSFLFRTSLHAGTTTIEPPMTDEQTKTRGESSGQFDDDQDDEKYEDLEYLIDSQDHRAFEDPFHILLMASTFEKPKITVSYVAGSLKYVLMMSMDEGVELSKFARDEGFSCLGTWPREECVTLGRQLQRRDLVCRVVPFCEGGQRGWQAKDASGSLRTAGGDSSV